MGSSDVFDTFVVPEFFISEVGKVEDAGGGCVRVYNCIRRGGELVPVFTVIIPSASLVCAGETVRDAALHIMRKDLCGAVH